ncbi:MAG: aldo/keto reductase, partial [Deltaproteobacteria bacterium]|nr:aldo/keto reductase [Deltaproteobacteria bacterium]
MSTDEKLPSENKTAAADADAVQPRKGLPRRAVLKAGGAGLLGGVALYGMNALGLFPEKLTPPKEILTDKMTYRVNPRNGDRISLLAFGCMRFPVLPTATRPSGPEINEAAATALVDYAMAHGVNYYDTAWRYHGGMSETLIGKALKRYPRESFFLADKMP